MKIIQLVLDQMFDQGKKNFFFFFFSLLYLIFYFSCNFETDFCGFSNLYNMDFRFERTHAYHLVHDYAPERDHTLNNLAGSFLYANTLSVVPNKKAIVQSLTFIPLDGCRVRFYYYINSATNAGQLTFMTRTESSGRTTILWSTSKVLGDYWERQELLISTGNLTELLIEVQSLSGGGIIAIDDISFSSQCNASNQYLPYGTTIAPNVTVTPPTCTYSCKDGTCIGREKVKLFFLLKIK